MVKHRGDQSKRITGSADGNGAAGPGPGSAGTSQSGHPRARVFCGAAPCRSAIAGCAVRSGCTPASHRVTFSHRRTIYHYLKAT
ncbi:hypothetical protein ACFW9F_01820 [Streptomyces sp. NPDC059506]|uniref:hypothetical protein n=1 Tax=Streptomyces sp. NPDC059506 TaxID=3347751 RepID=UPI0036787D90